ncbi:tail fiber domain-containing protein [Marivirga sp.]|uniref:tail fiber domain-containing protein n=1 Tax=Marivirga sp. TaxID=2018662 RepID=UPI002D7F2B82|nr:tail fiber domain-containing protein [Marivirga sp.]HET8859381.1 tail fiber domain-containing protein [Marivirga sp.]
MKNFSLLIILLFASLSLAAQKLPFQGYLEESGVPVNGARTFIFELPDYGWTETIADVSIDNGIYNVVLGESTLLPDSIFSNVNETPLSITVDTTNIGTVTLYKPLGLNKKNFELLNDTESKRGELKVDNSDAGELSLYGVNDSLNIRIGSFAGGYYGNLGIYDSLGVSNGFIRARSNGGLLQLNKLDVNGNFASAILASTNPTTSALLLYAQNPTNDNVSRMIENYTATREIFNGPVMSNNYKRSGTDWYDNEGRILAAVGNAREEAGDPEGGSGYVSLWGKNSFNAELTGKRWENNDLPTFQLFGNSDDGGTWWMRNFGVDINEAPSGYDYANLGLYNTDVGGVSQENVFITSNLYEQKAGGIELRDSIGTTTITLEGNTGIGNFQNAAIGSQTNGIVHLYGEDNTAIDNLRLQLEVRPDGIGSSFGFIELRDASYNTSISIDGSTGTITATGTVTSDKRLKKEITTLENSLSNTLKLRGASYYWKDENKSQKRQIGVIAQEVEEIYPEFVHTNEEGFKSVNYAQMTAVLIESIKELNQKIEHLEKDVAGLEKENETLTTALNETKALSERIGKLEKLLIQEQKVASN